MSELGHEGMGAPIDCLKENELRIVYVIKFFKSLLPHQRSAINLPDPRFFVVAMDQSTIDSDDGENGLLSLDEEGHVQIQQGNNKKIINDNFRNRYKLRQDSYKLLNDWFNFYGSQRGEKYISPYKDGQSQASLEGSKYREAEADRLGLVRLELPAFPKAQQLLEQLHPTTFGGSGAVDPADAKSINNFCRQWWTQNPGLPLPGMPTRIVINSYFINYSFRYPPKINQRRGDFTLFNALSKTDNFISSIWSAIREYKPDIGTPKVILMENINVANNRTNGLSPLLDKICSDLPPEKQNMDALLPIDVFSCLYHLNFGEKFQKTATHINILKELGLDADCFQLNFISFEQYLSAASNGWFNKPNVRVPISGKILDGRDGLFKYPLISRSDASAPCALVDLFDDRMRYVFQYCLTISKTEVD